MGNGSRKGALSDERKEELLRLIYATNSPNSGSAVDGHRFTQDSPVLPEVWLAYANDPDDWQGLLINPFMGRRAGLVARELREVTKMTRSDDEDEGDLDHPNQPAAIAHIPGLVAASLRFEEMLRVALPSTVWWEARIEAISKALGLESTEQLLVETAKSSAKDDDHTDDPYRDLVATWIADLPSQKAPEASRKLDHTNDLTTEEDHALREFLALIRLAGTILIWSRMDRKSETPPSPPDPEGLKPAELLKAQKKYETERQNYARRSARGIVDAFIDVYSKWEQSPTRGLIWNIALNRSAKLSGTDSSLSIKADAGRRLFDISCSDITWAMIDSGIDISSPAFCDWDARLEEAAEIEREKAARDDDAPSAKAANGRPPPPLEIQVAEALFIDRPLRLYSRDAERETMMRQSPEKRGWPTRVLERYDFTDIMRLLDISTAGAMHERIKRIAEHVSSTVPKGSIDAPDEATFWKIAKEYGRKAKMPGTVDLKNLRTVDSDKMQQMIRRILESTCVKIGRHQRQMIARTVVREAENVGHDIEKNFEGLKTVARWRLFKAAADSAEQQMDSLVKRIELGLELDWSILEEFLIDMTPDLPKSAHGTQVAGVLASDWRDEDNGATKIKPKIQGVCPDIRLIDLRVSDASGRTQEFEAIAALQFILHLNARSSEKAIHGANISLSIEHDVRNYGCGKTRICEMSEQLVASGVVVVAAAGNGGMIDYSTPSGGRYQGYQDGSITDPGNAEAVITVGATHASKPHQYGVSYFSSRGPTGDGRMKPDLVAPGEKITTCGLQGSIAIVDGTSFAAPHVSGAAALLMARHSELIGKPEQVKRVLVDTATNLGRDPNFQGAGMLDTLRALQSL